MIKKFKSFMKRVLIRIKTKSVKLENTHKLDNLYLEYRQFISRHRDITYEPQILTENLGSEKYKWVGGVYNKSQFVCFPNGSSQLLIADNAGTSKINVGTGAYKWTGGCIYNKNIYAFPRSKESFLKFKTEEKRAEEVVVGYKYEGEHHYGGECTENGIVYQPPRNCDHILKTDLNTGICYKLQLTPGILDLKFRYCGSILHPNGFIYFFPEEPGKVIKLNPINDSWYFISKKIYLPVYDAKVGCNGNIYGFSNYGKGILKIDVEHDQVKVLYETLETGAYGTKLGINGRMYSIPGDSMTVWEFDPETEKCKSFYKLRNNGKAKYAGGATGTDGTIYFTPANAETLMILEAKGNGYNIPDYLYTYFFKDCY